MSGFSAAAVIDAPIDDVFAVVADLGTHPNWAADGLVVERTGERTWRSVSRSKGRVFHADLLVTAIEPSRAFQFVASDETGIYRHSFDLEPTPEGCRVTRSVTAVRLGAGQRLLYWLTLAPIRRPAARVSLSRLAEVFA